MEIFLFSETRTDKLVSGFGKVQKEELLTTTTMITFFVLFNLFKSVRARTKKKLKLLTFAFVLVDGN